jgi:hypothetical protein
MYNVASNSISFFLVVPSFGQVWKSESNFRSHSVYVVTKLHYLQLVGIEFDNVLHRTY